MTIFVCACGYRIKSALPPVDNCPICGGWLLSQMGRAHSARVARESRALERKYKAEKAHRWGRPHHSSACSLCRISALVDVSVLIEAHQNIFWPRKIPRG